MLTALADNLFKQIGTTQVTKENAAGIFNAVEEMCAKLKIHAPEIHIANETFHAHPIVDKIVSTANAGAIGSKRILLTKPILKLFEAHDLNAPICDELKAIIGHELDHCSKCGRTLLLSRAPVLMFPAAAMIGLYIYNHAHTKAKSEGNTDQGNVLKHINDHVDEAKEQLTQKMQETKNAKEKEELGTQSGLITFAKYFAVGALGLGTGLLTTRYASRHFEFAADKAGAALVSKNAMISGLRKISEAAGHSISEIPGGEKFKGIIVETLHAHPSFAERVANIRSA